MYVPPFALGTAFGAVMAIVVMVLLAAWSGNKKKDKED